MTKSWVIADLHLGHMGVCKFTQSDGVTPLRPWDNPDDMDKALIANWNALVDHGDRVYVLGDVAINRKALSTLYALKGRKCLVKGNHDIFKLNDYTPHFDDIRACVVGKGYILTHIPIHPCSMGRYGLNIHGHLHSNRVKKTEKNREHEDDPRYLCVSVEQTGFKPVNLQGIIDKHVKPRMAEMGAKE